MRLATPAPNSTLERLLSMLRDVSGRTEPVELTSSFGRYFWEVRPIDFYLSVSTRGLPPGSYKITRQLTVAEVLQNRIAPSNPWRDWDQIPTHRGGLIGYLISEPSPKILTGIDVLEDPVLGDVLRPYRSAMVIPNFDGGRAINWGMQFSLRDDVYNMHTLEEALLTSNMIGVATRNLVALRRIEELNQKLNHQFTELSRVQRSLLPGVFPDIQGLTAATSYLTSEQAGGDYYDVFPVGDDRWAMLIADVSGHGAAAATIMAMLHAVLQTYDGAPEPASILEHVNGRLGDSRLDGSFITAFMGVYDATSGAFTYASAGHNPPRWKRGAEVVPLDAVGTPPLGVLDRL
ncbi:MAG: SpoIIE family protein phosphatase, partial [Phycisphaerales bacterium]|nr:SpoIIE family protein phosphatase [Phycisphaerales bacterium]